MTTDKDHDREEKKITLMFNNVKKFNFKRAAKVLGSLLLLELVYLNIILSVVLSAQKIYLIAENIVAISHKKNIDLKDITTNQLEEVYNLAIGRVIKVFKNNDFRLALHAITGSGSELMLLSTGRARRSSFGQVGPQPTETQVSSILTNGYSLKNIVVEN